MVDQPISSNNLSSRENQKQALEYLAEQARIAHYEGDGVLVNHICAVALSKVKEWLNKGNCLILFGDIHWSLTLALYWLVDDYMLLLVERIMEKLQPPPEDEKGFSLVLNQIFYLIQQNLPSNQQSLGDPAPAIKELMDCNLDWLEKSTECKGSLCENSILLTYTIELVWWRNPEGMVWLTLVNTWLENTTGTIQKHLSNLKNRLMIQTKAIYPHASFSIDQEKILKEWEPNIQKLYYAWENFFECKWQELDEDLKTLVGNIFFESETSLPLEVFHFHHLSRFHRKSPGSQESGLTRRKLQICLRKEALFDDFRAMAFYEKIAGLWNEDKSSQNAHKGAHERFHCFRLSMLNQISALRRWELVSWMEGIRQQFEANRELFRFKGEEDIPEIAAELIRLAVVSRIFKEKDPTMIDAARQLDKASDELREKLIKTLLFARKFFWPYVLCAFSLLSDAIPESLLTKVAEWCNKYVNYPIAPFTGNPLGALLFWKDILGHIHCPNDVFKNLHPIAIKIAENLSRWSFDTAGIEEYLINAPLNLALEVGEIIFATETQNQRDNNFRFSVGYNAAQKRPELLDHIHGKLMATAKTLLQKQHLLYLKAERLQPIDNPEFRSWCRNQILSLAQGIIKRQAKSNQFGGQLNPKVMELVTWPEAEQELVSSLLDAIKAPHVQSQEIYLLMMCLYELVFKGPKTHSELVKQDFFIWLNELPKGEAFGSNIGGPLSPAQINFGNYEAGVFMAFSFLAIAMCMQDGDKTARKVAKWIMKNILDAPLEANARLFKLAIFLGISSNYLDKATLGSCIQTILLRSDYHVREVAGDHNLLNNLLNQIAYLLNPDANDPVNIFKAKRKPSKLLLFTILESWIPLFAKNDDADVRANTARILKHMEQHKPLSPKGKEIFMDLQRDARARVRHAAG